MLPNRIAAFVLLWCVLFAAPAQATTVEKMDLAQMCDVAGRIFRGTVVDTKKGTVSAGGGDVPVISYRVRIIEQLKGTFPTPSDGELILTITSVNLKAIEVPRLTVGQDYLLLTTTPSSVGLSTMVGLGQGTFKIYGEDDTELAVNALNNAGLANGLRGPTPYQDLAERIRTILRRGPQ